MKFGVGKSREGSAARKRKVRVGPSNLASVGGPAEKGPLVENSY